MMVDSEVDENSFPSLVELDADHPGFNDGEYRRRRDEIALSAMTWNGEGRVPDVEYTEAEHAVWQEVWRNLEPLHQSLACAEYLEAATRIALPRHRIPQLGEVNDIIGPISGFNMIPVAGLVTARSFLEKLGGGTFLSTQYMRHHSVPLYTPEPDVVHELVGHAATFAHEEFAILNRAFGRAAERADDEQVEAIGRVYWFTMEFGLLREGVDMKAYGAGLLSSFGELGSFRERTIVEWDLDRMAATPYDPTRYQHTLFVAPPFARMIDELMTWLDRF